MNLEEYWPKVKSFVARNAVALLLAAVAVLIVWLAWGAISTNKSEIDELYKTMQLREDSIRAEVRETYKSTTTTPELVSYLEDIQIEKYHKSPEYTQIDKQIKKIDLQNDQLSFIPFIGYFLFGFPLASIITGIILFTMTHLKFTNMLLKGDDDKYCATEAAAAVGLINSIFTTTLRSYTLLICAFMVVKIIPYLR